ncbi:MAG: oligosaccharide flippase family protein [Bacteroidota bacterium]|nr:oligosaccharide flippase family protein [Bacteroidota bacterium]
MKQILSYSSVNIINASVPFLLLPLLTAYLSPYDYGVLSMVQLLMLLSFPFVMMNSKSLLTMEYSNLSKKKYKSLVSSALLIPLMGFLFLEFIFFLFNDSIIKYFQLPDYLLYLIPVFLFFQVVPTFVPIIFQAKKEPFNFGRFKISLTLLNVLLSLLFVVVLNYGWEGRLFGIVGSFVLFSFIGLIVLFKIGAIGLTFDYESLKKILNFGIPLLPHAIAGILLASSSKFFLANMINNEAVGIYTVAFQVASAVLLIMTSINQAWAPNLYEILNSNPTEFVKISIVKKTYKVMLFMLAITFSFIICVPYVFKFFINEQYYSGILISKVLSIGFLMNGLYFLVTNYILFSKKTKILSYITTITSIVGAIINYYLILEFGIIGAAYGLIVTFGLLFIVVFYYSNKLYKMPWLLKQN